MVSLPCFAKICSSAIFTHRLEVFVTAGYRTLDAQKPVFPPWSSTCIAFIRVSDMLNEQLNRVRIRGTATTGCARVEAAAPFVSLPLQWGDLPAGPRRGSTHPAQPAARPAPPRRSASGRGRSGGAGCVCTNGWLFGSLLPFRGAEREKVSARTAARPRFTRGAGAGLVVLWGCLFPK